MRRSVTAAVLGLLILSLVVPAAASARPAQRFTERNTVVECFEETADGAVLLTAGVDVEFGGFLDIVFWPTGSEPFEDEPSVITASSEASLLGSVLSGTAELVTYVPENEPPYGDPAGEAAFEATLSPDGDPIAVDEHFKFGNRVEKTKGTVQPLTADGGVELPGADIDDLSGCFARSVDLAHFANDPSAFIDVFDETSVDCFWEDGDTSISFFAFADPSGFGFGEVFVGSETREVGGGADATLTTSSLATDVIELRDFGADEIVGEATASADLVETGEVIRTVDRNGRDWAKFVDTILSVDGTLELTLDGTEATYPIDDEHCFARQTDGRFHEVRPAGPKPRPYANEGPEDAIALRLGRSVKLVVGAGAFDPEAPCLDDEGFEFPLANTAWWSIVGTGGELTADTAGSAIDTILGVYVDDGGTLVQGDCVVDVDTLQARITWASDAGVTYLIQAGAFGGGSGRIELVVR